MFALAVSDGDREEAGAMVVDVGVEIVLVKVVYQRRPFLRDMVIAQMLTDDRGVFALHQGIVIGLAGAGFGELNDQ